MSDSHCGSDQPELHSSCPSFPWNIKHPHILEGYEGFDSQPMTPPSNIILKEPPRVKARRTKYWALLGEQEHIPEKSEVKNVIATDLRTYISPEDGEEITYIHNRPMFTLPDYTCSSPTTSESSMDYSDINIGDITSEVMSQKLSAGPICDEDGSYKGQRSVGRMSPDHVFKDFYEDQFTDSSSVDEFQVKQPARCQSENSLGYHSFAEIFPDNTEIGRDHRPRSLSTTDLKNSSVVSSEFSLMSKIHNRFSASTEALKQMTKTISRTRHTSGPEIDTSKYGVKPPAKQDQELEKVAVNAVLLSS